MRRPSVLLRMGDVDGPPLRRFTVAHGLAAAGDAMATVSLAGSLFFSVSPEASRRQVLVYLVVAMVPFVLIAPLVGPAIDRFRYSHRWLAASFYVGRAASAIAIAVFLYDLGLYFFALLALVLNKASGVVKQALVPSLVDSARLVAANSRLAVVATVAGAVGGGIGAAALQLHAAVALALAAASFLGAAVAVATIPPAGRELAGAPDSESESIEYQELHTPGVQAASNAMALVRAAVGLFVFGLAFALRRSSEPAWMYGAAIAMFSGATFLANVISPALRRLRPEPHLITGALLALFVCAGFAALGPSRPIVLLVVGILGLSAGVSRQAFDSLVQRRAPLAVRGRSFARFETRFQLAWAVGGTLGTALAASIQVSMAVIALTLAPGVVLYVRATADELRFAGSPAIDAVTIARRHLELASELFDAGQPARAATELSAGIDALLVGDEPLHPSIVARAGALRAAALDGDAGGVDVEDVRLGLTDLAAALRGEVGAPERSAS